MLTFNPPKPNRITLITTFRCMALCESCCFGCRPDTGRTMTLEQMKRYVDLCMEAYPDSISEVSITGGECFMLGDDLAAIIEYAKSRYGLTSGIVSNGYWGKSYAKAFDLLWDLQRKGLKYIEFSIGNSHQAVIPLKNSRNAVVAAARLGFVPTVRLESRWGTPDCWTKLQKDTAFMKLVNQKKIKVEHWGWREYNNETKHRRYFATRYRPTEEKPCKFLFKDIIITPYGDVMACCGISCARIPYMRLGNIEKEPIKSIYERGLQDALKVWIREKGANDVLRFVYDNSEMKFHTWGNACKSCDEIFGNPEIIPFLRDHYDEWIEKIKYLSKIW